MMLEQQAHAVLLPAFGEARLSGQVRRFLSSGGCAILLGESREEYVARRMSRQRVAEETAETLSGVVDEARSLAGDVLVCVDQELEGIRRLHDLVPPFPPLRSRHPSSPEALREGCGAVAAAARNMGINCFLAPVLDLVTGDNPWLAGRTWSTDPHLVASLSSIFIEAVQGAGVIAVAKHFPGYSWIPLDPAVESEARNSGPQDSLKKGFIPFAAAVDSGVEAIMTGPAIVEALDPERAASLSPAIISMLRSQLDFKGMVMSDDLDAPAILQGRSVAEAAVEALAAGSDLLLIGDIDDQLENVAAAIVRAVKDGTLEEARLVDAAAKVRSLTRKYRIR